MTILITGATGQLGSIVVDSLLTLVPADQLAVSVRNPEKAGHLRERGVDVRHGDFDDPASLERAFAGVSKLLLISTDGDNDTRIRQHRAAVAAAKQAGVQHIVYTSLANAEASPLGLAAVHRDTEAQIRATGIPYTFLRNNWYLENELGSIKGALAGAPIITSAGSGKSGWAPRADYAAAAAAVLTGSGHENKVYELSGPLYTYNDLGAALAEVLGRDVPVEHVSDEGYAAALTAVGLPPFVASLLAGFQSAIRAGALEVQSDDFATLLGRQPTPLKEALAQLVTALNA